MKTGEVAKDALFKGSAVAVILQPWVSRFLEWTESYYHVQYDQGYELQLCFAASNVLIYIWLHFKVKWKVKE